MADNLAWQHRHSSIPTAGCQPIPHQQPCPGLDFAYLISASASATESSKSIPMKPGLAQNYQSLPANPSFAFPSPNEMNPTQLQGHLALPSPSPTETVSQFPSNNMGLHLQAGSGPNQSYYGDATSTLPTPGSIIDPADQHCTLNQALPNVMDEPNSIGLCNPRQAELTDFGTDKKAILTPCSRRQSQESSSSSENNNTDRAAPLDKSPKQDTTSPNSAKKCDSSERDDQDDASKARCRERMLHRNRVAVNKARLRKRDEVSALASKERAMKDENQHLTSCFDSLMAQIYHLKTQLLLHTDCNCTLIQKYIAVESRKSVDGPFSSLSAFNAYDSCPGGLCRRDSTETTRVEAMHRQTPDAKRRPHNNAWSGAMQQDPHALAAREQVTNMGNDAYQAAAALPSAVAPSAVGVAPTMPVSGFHPYNSYTNMGYQPTGSENILWDVRWNV